MIPILKSDRASSIEPTAKIHRNDVRKSKFAKNVSRMSSRSANENTSQDAKISACVPDSSRLGFSSRVVERKRADSGLSKDPASVKDYLNISDCYASTKMSSYASPMSKHSRRSSWKQSGQHGYESEDGSDFSSSVKEVKMTPGQTMHIRLLKKLQACLPDVDMEDFKALNSSTI